MATVINSLKWCSSLRTQIWAHRLHKKAFFANLILDAWSLLKTMSPNKLLRQLKKLQKTKFWTWIGSFFVFQLFWQDWKKQKHGLRFEVTKKRNLLLVNKRKTTILCPYQENQWFFFLWRNSLVLFFRIVVLLLSSQPFVYKRFIDRKRKLKNPFDEIDVFQKTK